MQDVLGEVFGPLGKFHDPDSTQRAQDVHGRAQAVSRRPGELPSQCWRKAWQYKDHPQDHPQQAGWVNATDFDQILSKLSMYASNISPSAARRRWLTGASAAGTP